MNLKLKFRILEKYGSQARFSQVVKERETYISRAIHGRYQPDCETCQEWARALDCQPNDIFPQE